MSRDCYSNGNTQVGKASGRQAKGARKPLQMLFLGPQMQILRLTVQLPQTEAGKENQDVLASPDDMPKERGPKQCTLLQAENTYFLSSTPCRLPLFKVQLKGTETLDAQQALGQPGAVCIHPGVHWSRSSDSQHLRPCAISYSFQVRSLSIKPLQRGRNH